MKIAPNKMMSLTLLLSGSLERFLLEVQEQKHAGLGYSGSAGTSSPHHLSSFQRRQPSAARTRKDVAAKSPPIRWASNLAALPALIMHLITFFVIIAFLSGHLAPSAVEGQTSNETSSCAATDMA